ncbi:MAG: glycosyl hydrolase 115 family protein [Acidobacteriota bacterium]|nr:glycosyl hydrolase 115 family protein [Acidobacteriota bacterium]
MLSFRVVNACSRLLRAAVAFGLLPLAAVSAAWPQGHTITIDSSVTMVESAQETGPVQRATQDLRADFAKVFGQAPRLAGRLEDAGPVTILIAERSHLPAAVPCTTTVDTEAFAFSIVKSPRAKQRQVVCLTGADMRGTIFAIYEFSQSVLGVDPMYLWTDKQPGKRTSIQLRADFAHVFPSPVFRYRGFFPNDEDLLTGWIPAEKGAHTGISLKVWNSIFETTLRLKGNMIVPGTWIFPDDAQVQAAAQRGLIINQHHAIPLGVNVARWPQGVPYNFSTHPEILERAWSNAVDTYKPGEEILWSVGLRGLSDSSYASLDPSVRNNDPLLGKRVNDAIAEQMRIVRARYPKAQFVTDLWQEGARLMQEGYLKIPPEVLLVWADTGYGDMQDGGKVAAGQGAYFHVAMMNGHANQLSEMVPVAVIQEELGRYIKAGATSYFLVNTSDFRPVAMTTKAVMDIAWAGLPKTTSDADGAFYRQWATEEFGARSAEALEKVYKEYFAAPAPRAAFRVPGLTSAGNPPPPPPKYSNVPLEEGDQHYHTEARRLILDALSEHQVIAIPSQSPKWTQPRALPSGDAATRRAELEEDIAACTAAQPRWDAVARDALAAESQVAPERRNYYQAGVLTMITINRESNRMLMEVARSLQDNEAGRTEKAEAEASAALQALDTIRKSMDAAEYGKWKNWYRGDWLTGVYRTRELVQDYANHIKDPMAKLPAPAAWNGWEAYFHIMEYEGDRAVDVH